MQITSGIIWVAGAWRKRRDLLRILSSCELQLFTMNCLSFAGDYAEIKRKEVNWKQISKTILTQRHLNQLEAQYSKLQKTGYRTGGLLELSLFCFPLLNEFPS